MASRRSGGAAWTAWLTAARWVAKSQTPRPATASSGMSLSTVVTSCTKPAVRAPRRLKAVNSHTMATVARADQG